VQRIRRHIAEEPVGSEIATKAAWLNDAVHDSSVYMEPGIHAVITVTFRGDPWHREALKIRGMRGIDAA